MKAAYLSALTPEQIRYCLHMASMYPPCWRAMVLLAGTRAVDPHPVAVAILRRITFPGLISIMLPDLQEAIYTHTQEDSHG